MHTMKPFVDHLEAIVKKLKTEDTLEKKYKALCILKDKKSILPEKFLNSTKKKYLYKCLECIDQENHIFHDYDKLPNLSEKIEELFDRLWEVESFYSPMGGIIGYHLTFLKLILQKNEIPEIQEYEHPEGINLTQEDSEVALAVRKGIEMLQSIGEIYPVAGAGDRLDLKDEQTGEPLPAALLSFLGFSLINGLMRDLQAREFLHFKVTGNQARTPVILMTSHEKRNDEHIRNILTENKWFHRSPDLFFYILQPLVPVITTDGIWAIQEPLKLNLKPGGHGVIWRLADNTGALDWFLKHNRRKALVRQINNPIAGIDLGLLALSGIGCYFDKAFGFATCFRLLGAAEGVDVLIEKKTPEGYEYVITNIEYTEFDRFGIKDTPSSPSSRFSLFPSNTNLLFIDIPLLKQILQEHPFPGLLVNLKCQSECLDKSRNIRKIEAGRIESTMQNIADYIVTRTNKKLTKDEKKNLRTFVTYNEREKTISTTKKLANGDQVRETPDGAFYDLQCNAYKVFRECGFTLPDVLHEKAFVEKPPFIIAYHPGLGPLFSVIKQKIQNGRIEEGSELKLEIAELHIQNLSLKGSLHINALCPLGHLDQNSELVYSDGMGKCILRNVTVENAGINFSVENTFWKSDIVRNEVLCIQIEGNGEFIAEDVIFGGPFQICVPAGHRLTAKMQEQKVQFHLSPIDCATWRWVYSFNDRNELVLELNNFS